MTKTYRTLGVISAVLFLTLLAGVAGTVRIGTGPDIATELRPLLNLVAAGGAATGLLALFLFGWHEFNTRVGSARLGGLICLVSGFAAIAIITAQALT